MIKITSSRTYRIQLREGPGPPWRGPPPESPVPSRILPAAVLAGPWAVCPESWQRYCSAAVLSVHRVGFGGFRKRAARGGAGRPFAAPRACPGEPTHLRAVLGAAAAARRAGACRGCGAEGRAVPIPPPPTAEAPGPAEA